MVLDADEGCIVFILRDLRSGCQAATGALEESPCLISGSKTLLLPKFGSKDALQSEKRGADCAAAPPNARDRSGDLPPSVGKTLADPVPRSKSTEY